MSQEVREEVVSSDVRLKMADLISVRPRTLRELKAHTGLRTVQAVLKHLKKLKDLRLVKEMEIAKGHRKHGKASLSSRKLYTVDRGVHVRNFSDRDFTVVKVSNEIELATKSSDPVQELESLAMDTLLQRRRIRDQARKLGRMIDELVSTEAQIGAIAHAAGADDEDRFLLQVAFAEESREEAEKSLRAEYGPHGSRDALEKAIAKAKRLSRK